MTSIVVTSWTALPGATRVAAADLVSLGGAFDPVVPARLLDTRVDGVTVDGAFQAIGLRTAGSVTELQVTGRGQIPLSAAAVALNVTVAGAQGAGFVTVWPCGAEQPTASSVNYTAGQTVPNTVISKLDAGGRVCVFTLAAVDLLVDVTGSFALGSSFTSLVPARLLDTRPGQPTTDGLFAGIGTAGPDSIVELQVTGRAGVAAGTTAVALNVTATNAQGPGFVTVWPCGEQRPTASNLNYAPGQTVPNAVISQLDATGRVCLYTLAPADLIVDVNGAFMAGSAFRSLVPARLMETRSGLPTVDGQFAGGGARAAGSVTALTVVGRGGVGADATTVALNVTVVGAQGAGFVTVWPCGQDRPTASSLNYQAGQTVPNAVITKVGTDGTVCLYTLATVDLIVDVNGSVDHAWSMTVTPAAGTVIVGGTDIIAITGTSDTGGTVTLAAGVTAPAVGGHLAVAPHPLAPSGLVGTVSAATPGPAGTTVVTFVPADLKQVFTDLRYHYGGPLTPLTGSGGTPARSQDALGCTGSISPNLGVNFTGGELDVDMGVLDAHILARIDGEVTAGIQFGGSVEISCEIALPAVTFILPFATVDLVPKLSVSISGQLTAGAQLTAPFSVGVEATPTGAPNNLSTASLSGSGDTSVDAQGTITARAAIEPQIKLFGLAGGTLNLGVNLNILARPLEVPCGAVTANASVQFGLEIGRWGLDWSITLATINFPEVTFNELRLVCPAAQTAWVGTIGASVDMDRQSFSNRGDTDIWENDYAWTVTSTATDMLSGFPTFGPGGTNPPGMTMSWDTILIYHRQFRSEPPAYTYECTQVGGANLSSSFSARMYDTSFQPTRKPAPNSTVYVELMTVSYTGAPQTFVGTLFGSLCPATGGGPQTIPSIGTAWPPGSTSIDCLPGMVPYRSNPSGPCLVVAHVSADGTRIDTDLSMTGPYTTRSGTNDAGAPIYRVHNTVQHVSIHLSQTEV